MSTTSSSVAAQPAHSHTRSPDSSIHAARAETPILAPALAKSKARAVAWGPVDMFEPAPLPARHLRLAPNTGAAPRARAGLAVERGHREFRQATAKPEQFSVKELHRAQAHFLEARAHDARSAAPVLGLVQTAEMQVAHVRPFAPCDRAQAQKDVVTALCALADFLTEGSDADLATVLGQSQPLWLTRLSTRAKNAILDKLLPALELLLSAAAYETTGEVRTMALKALAHLVAHQVWAAAPALGTIEAWAKHMEGATTAEVAAACDVIRSAIGAQSTLAPTAREVTLRVIKGAGDDVGKRALCAPLMSVCMHGVDRSQGALGPTKRLAGIEALRRR